MSARAERDVMAKYRRETPTARRGVEYETASTTPAGGSASIQDIPPPTTNASTRKATPLPAMEPLSIPAPSTNSASAESKPTAEEKEVVVQGVVIPPKPRPPTEEECCMSGCVHCVYNIYADDLETYTEAVAQAHKALLAAGTPKSAWPPAVRRLEDKASGPKGAGGKEAMVDQEKEQVTQGMDPVLAAFLAMEGKLKKKQVSSKGSTA